MEIEQAKQMRDYVLDEYLKTGKAVFVRDVMALFRTSAMTVRKYCDYENFDYDKDDYWTGDSYSGKYIQAPCVEPSKWFVAKTLRELKGL
jgi:hypothetical protein